MAWISKEAQKAYRDSNIERYRKNRRSYYAKNKGKIRGQNTEWRRRNEATLKSSKLKRVYGITLEQYDSIFESQRGICAICKSQPKNKRLCVEHNHKTKEVRGLTCDRCNVGLGMFGDSVELLLEAAAYLVRSE